eukprot:352233-Chlamydomonas_euryale.AAC.1
MSTAERKRGMPPFVHPQERRRDTLPADLVVWPPHLAHAGHPITAPSTALFPAHPGRTFPTLRPQHSHTTPCPRLTHANFPPIAHAPPSPPPLHTSFASIAKTSGASS